MRYVWGRITEHEDGHEYSHYDIWEEFKPGLFTVRKITEDEERNIIGDHEHVEAFPSKELQMRKRQHVFYNYKLLAEEP